MVDRHPHRYRAAKRETSDVGIAGPDGSHERGQVGRELHQRAVGPAKAGFAMTPQVIHEHPMPEHEIGKRPPPGPVIVRQAMNQD